MLTTRLGILGFAHGHVGMYCSRWREMADVQLVAGWDHDAARATAARDQHGVALADSPQALLARPDLDAVVIAAETSRHADLVELAAAAGKTIILQKPLALTLAEADRIVAAVERTGTRFTLAWQMRADAQNLRLRQLVQEGTLGRITLVRRRHDLSTQLWPDFDKSWHVQPALNRGMWADDAAHAIDFIYWLLGEPQTVVAEIATLVNPQVPDDHGVAVFRYADGTLAHVVSSFTCVAGENTTEVVGTQGTAIQNYGDGPSCGAPRPAGAVGLKWYRQETKQWTDSGIPSPGSHAERIFGLARPLIEFARGERAPLATAAEGRAVLRMTLACYESSAQGRRIKLEAFRP